MQTILRGRGRPVTSDFARHVPREDCQDLQDLARMMRAEFDKLSPAAQCEAIQRTLLILSDADQVRVRPSPLARIARYVYGITLDWVPAEYQVYPVE